VEEAVSLADLPRGGVNGNFAVVEFHDTGKPELWPFLNLVNQLARFEDNRGVPTVFVYGRMVLEDGRITAFDEEHFFAGCQAGGGAVVHGLGYRTMSSLPRPRCPGCLSLSGPASGATVIAQPAGGVCVGPAWPRTQGLCGRPWC